MSTIGGYPGTYPGAYPSGIGMTVSVPAGGSLAFPGVAFPGATYPGAIAGTGWIFRPPTHRRNVFSSQDRLWQRFHYPTGLTVLKWPDGSYQTVEEVDPDQLEQASIAYIGGHEYDVDGAEAAALTAAGYEVTNA